MANKKYGTIRASVALLIVGLLGLFIFSAIVKDQKWVDSSYEAENGVLNLSSWQEEKSATQLNGYWRFYKGKFAVDIDKNDSGSVYVKTPNSWERMGEMNYSPMGYGTYKLKVTGLVPSKIYGLKMLDQVTAYRLTVNGELVAFNGQIGKDKKSYSPEWRPVLSSFKTSASGEADFTMELANFDYSRGGFWNSITIGEQHQLQDYTNLRALSEAFLFAGLFVMAAFFMGMHLLYPSEKDTMVFALFCLMSSIQVAFTGERIIQDFLPFLTWGLSLRLEYLSGYILMPLFGLYVNYRFPKDTPQKTKRYFFAMGIILTLITFLTPHWFYAQLIRPVKYLTIATVPYFVYVFYRVHKEERNGSQLSFVAFVVLFLSVLKDTFMASEFSALPYGAFIFMIAFSLITISKYVLVQRNNELLEHRVIRDALTGTFNRTYLESFIEMGGSNAYYVLFLDLDRFKIVNDTFGHDTGDQVLIEVSRRIRKQVRFSDVICRYGGDEFVILVLDEADVDIDQIAERIVSAIKEPMPEHMGGACVGASIGISHYPEDGSDLNDLIRRSDLEMYRTKLNGGNGHNRHQTAKC